MNTGTQVPTETRGVWYPGSGATDGCEPPGMDTENQTQVL